LVLFLAAGIILTIKFWPDIYALKYPDTREAYTEALREQGLRGWLLFLSLCVLQLVIPLIPAGPVEILAGLAYGPLGGTLSCLLGFGIGTAIAYGISFFIGKLFFGNVHKNYTYRRFSFLNDRRKAYLAVMVLFTIPGFPKDTLVFFAPFTAVKGLPFILLSTLCRMPFILVSVLIGSSVEGKEYHLLFAVLTILLISSTLSILYREKILRLLRSHHKKNKGLDPNT